MFKPNKLLKVVSVILIIFGALSVVSSIIGYVGVQSLKDMQGVDMTVIKAAYTPLNLAIGLCSALLMVICGILGVKGKAYKPALILMIVYVVIDIISLFISGIAMTALTWTSLIIGLILPLLYLWGLYQSKE
ncbi:MAG: hypothetical protein RR869_05325 [Lachnospiraceae bacterium]